MEGANLGVLSRQKRWRAASHRVDTSHLESDLILLSRCCRPSSGYAAVGYLGCESSRRSAMVAAGRGMSGRDVAVVVGSSLSP